MRKIAGKKLGGKLVKTSDEFVIGPEKASTDSWRFQSTPGLTELGKKVFSSSFIYEYLEIALFKEGSSPCIVVQASTIPHFKDFVMKIWNVKQEFAFKNHTKSQWQCKFDLIFSESDFTCIL